MNSHLAGRLFVATGSFVLSLQSAQAVDQAALTALSKNRTAALNVVKAGHEESFRDFKKSMGTIDSAQLSNKLFGDDAQKDAISTAKMALVDFYKSLKVTQTVQVRSRMQPDQYVAFDCVSTVSQPALRNPDSSNTIESPPQDPESPSTALAASASGGTEKASKNPPIVYRWSDDAACPQGNVPIVRVTLPEMLMSDESSVPSLDRVLFNRLNGIKEGEATLLPRSPTVHRYAHAAYKIPNIGAASRLNVWSPMVPSDEMSLSQIWVVGSDAAYSTQTVEAGWQVMSFWHTPFSTIFVYATADDYNGTGCYATRCPESGRQVKESFVLATNKIIIGKPIAAQSVAGATQSTVDVKWLRSPDTGSWWLKIDNDWVGYYPKSFFGSGPLSMQATYVDFGGETAGITPTSQMGSGRFANEGWTKAAYQSRLRYFTTDGHVAETNVQADATDESCYTVSVNGPSPPPNDDGTYIFFGGPGLSANGSTASVHGPCSR
jgi:hypothetical protein